MTDDITIFIVPPRGGLASWQVKADGLPEQAFQSHQAALSYAAIHANQIEDTGRSAIIKIQKSDGTWETFVM
jgi:hypothetical protein